MVLKEPIFTVSILEGHGDLERTHFLTLSTLGGCDGLERTNFNSFYYGRVWRS